jgi:hypothetical protein
VEKSVWSDDGNAAGAATYLTDFSSRHARYVVPFRPISSAKPVASVYKILPGKGDVMRNVTYEELFNESLEKQITAGGDFGKVVTAVLAYSDVIGRHLVFQEWLRDNEIRCGLCGKPFQPDIQAVEEDHYVLCPACRKQN